MAPTDTSGGPREHSSPEEPPEHNVQANRDHIYVKLGRCLVRLQQIEVGMKHLAGLSHMSRPTEEFVSAIELRRARIAGQTLGSVSELVATQVIVPPDWEPAHSASDESAPAMLGAGFTIGVPDETRDQVLSDLKELVERRNFLVHGLIERYDIWSIDGCQAADEYVDTTFAFIGTQLDQLRDWVTRASESSQMAAAIFEQPEVRELFFHGILPDGGVWWPTATIVGVLRAAETELAENGWTSLDKAIAFARAHAPDHTPRRYGCSSWRQVLRESGQFEIRRDRNPIDGTGSTRYRSKPTAQDSSNTATWVLGPDGTAGSQSDGTARVTHRGRVNE